jgi:hypothetical protein
VRLDEGDLRCRLPGLWSWCASSSIW